MKKVIAAVFLLSLSCSLIAQDNNNNTPQTNKKKGLTAPYFGISVMFEGANYFASKGNIDSSSKPQLIINPILDLKLGQDIFFLGQFGGSFVATSGIYRGGGIFAGAGVGKYIFDKRVNGIGNSLTLSLSFVFRNYNVVGKKSEPIDNKYLDFLDSLSSGSTTSLGGQLLVSYYYNISKNLGFMVGLNLDIYHEDMNFVNSNRDYIRYSGEGLGLLYGLSVGIAF